MLLLLSAAAVAATLTVGASGTYATIGDAISAAASGDTLEVEAGTYAECLDLAGKDLIVLGTAGSASTTLDGTGCDSALVAELGETVRVQGFTVANSGGRGFNLTGGALSLIDVVVRDAGDDELYGGAVAMEGGALTLQDCELTGNLAYRGGAIYAAEGGTVALYDTLLSANLAFEHGGAIYGRRGLEIEASDTAFEQNQALYGSGGAVYLYGGGALRADASQLTGSYAWESGGAVYLEYGVEASLTDVDLSDNTADYGAGGAWYQYFYGTLGLDGVTVSGNTAMEEGGGLVVDYLVGAVQIQHSSFTDNTSTDGDGGGLWADTYLDLVVTGSVFTGNRAAFDGAGLYAALVGELGVTDTEFTSNTATEGNGGGLMIAPQIVDVYAVALDGLRFEDNLAGMAGGGLYVSGLARLDLSGSDFVENRADDLGEGYAGGGAYVGGTAAATLEENLVCGNLASNGGGVYLSADSGADSWRNNVLQENTAYDRGGGLYLVSSAHSFVNNTLVGNTAGTAGGGGWYSDATLDLRNNIVAGTSNGSGLYTDDPDTAAAALVRYNAWHENLAQHAGGDFAFSTSADGNLEADPGFTSYTPDGDCTNDDLGLAAGSALIDAGDPTLFDGDCTRSDIGADGGPWLDYVDADGDGHLGATCAGADCDDADPSIYPGATEIFDDGIDQDCDGADSVTPADDTGDDTGDDTAVPGDDTSAPADDTDATDKDEGCGGCGSGGSAGLFGALLLGGARRRRGPRAHSRPQLAPHSGAPPRVAAGSSVKPA